MTEDPVLVITTDLTRCGQICLGRPCVMDVGHEGDHDVTTDPASSGAGVAGGTLHAAHIGQAATWACGLPPIITLWPGPMNTGMEMAPTMFETEEARRWSAYVRQHAQPQGMAIIDSDELIPCSTATIGIRGLDVHIAQCGQTDGNLAMLIGGWDYHEGGRGTTRPSVARARDRRTAMLLRWSAQRARRHGR